ncbi:M23 family metallopeptidase [Nocardioidaceae bacterium]|nr:M23 family metallopeptidase [Nocardioidaceae bacterium]
MGHERPTSHRAPGRARRRAAGGTGRRQVMRTRTRAAVTVPLLTGLAVFSVIGGGTAADSAAISPTSGPAPMTTPPMALTAASPVSAFGSYASLSPRAVTGSSTPIREAVLLDRGLPVSRDSERQALGQSSRTELRPASGAVAKQSNAALAELAQAAQETANRTPQNSWKLPLQSYRLTAFFGQGGALWSSRHTGLDFAAPEGTILSSITPGRVISASYAGAYGERIIIRTPDGIELSYCHLSAYGVQVGDQVVAGQTIGKVGTTGNSTGPHLHLEVRPGGGDPVDPFAALVSRGVNP